jgi:hypothetical protein
MCGYAGGFIDPLGVCVASDICGAPASFMQVWI